MTKCEYCGENEAVDKIGNPNLDYSQDIDWNDKKSWWKVCKDCKDIIVFRKFGSPIEMIELNPRLKEIMKKEFVVVISNPVPEKEGKE